MKRVFRYIILASLVLTSMLSCEFDHLHYETNLKALVRIDVDWSRTKLSPNGVSAYVYDASGDLYTKELSSSPDVVYLKLPAGNYTVVLHNNSMSELSHLSLYGNSLLQSSSIYATKRGDSPAFEVPQGTKDPCSLSFINEPNDAASYTLRDIEVTSSDIEYHYYKPNLSDYEQECHYIYKATPQHIVHLARVIAHIGRLDNAAGVPTAILSGMSRGYGFDKESNVGESVMEEFKVNTRVSTKGDEPDDAPEMIYVDYNTFGLHTTKPDSKSYYLDIRFKLKDGSYKDYHVDVTNEIHTDTLQYQKRHIIEVELEALPEIEGEDPDVDIEDDTFDPTVDDWVDVEVDLPM